MLSVRYVLGTEMIGDRREKVTENGARAPPRFTFRTDRNNLNKQGLKKWKRCLRAEGYCSVDRKSRRQKLVAKSTIVELNYVQKLGSTPFIQFHFFILFLNFR